MKKLTLAVMTTCSMLGAATVYAQSDDPAAWDPQAAAAYLGRRGADVSLCDSHGKDAMEYTKHFNHAWAVELLRVFHVITGVDSPAADLQSHGVRRDDPISGDNLHVE